MNAKPDLAGFLRAAIVKYDEIIAGTRNYYAKPKPGFNRTGKKRAGVRKALQLRTVDDDHPYGRRTFDLQSD